jgi:hypothetical protein
MRVKLLLVGATFALTAGPANAQAWIGTFAGNLLDRGDMKWCYQSTAKPNAKYLAGQVRYMDQAMDKYLGLARTSGNLDKMFTGTRDHRLMSIDEMQADPRTAQDPWAVQAVKLDSLGYVMSNDMQNIHGHWRAIASNGAALGTYDALLRAGVGGYHIRQVRLISASSTAQLDELKPFCIDPGDIEKWQEAKAKRDAEKATRDAARNRATPSGPLR